MLEKKVAVFSIDNARFFNRYDFTDPENIISNFIERVSTELGNIEGEFRLICSIINQSVAQVEGKRLYTNSCFTTGIIQGSMNDRVKDFLYINSKKRVLVNGENGSNVYFSRFDFLKIHCLSSNLDNVNNIQL